MVGRIVEITHFKDKKVSSQLIVDSEEPYLKEGKYVKAGGFWFKPNLQGQSMKLSLNEAVEFATRLLEEAKRLIARETEMRIKQDEEYKRSKS